MMVTSDENTLLGKNHSDGEGFMPTSAMVKLPCGFTLSVVSCETTDAELSRI